MRVVIHHAGPIHPVVELALTHEAVHHRTNDPPYRPAPLSIQVERIDVSRDRHAYGDALAQRWAIGAPFINLEHDVAPWPGGLSALWQCPEDWCALPLIVHGCVNERNLGCVKFSAAFLARYPALWTRYPRNAVFDWRSLDAWLYGTTGRLHHRHGPPALHCNPHHADPLEERPCPDDSLAPA